jgi:hypothetical protein
MGTVGIGFSLYCLLSLMSVSTLLFEIGPALVLLRSTMLVVGGFGIWIAIKVWLQVSTTRPVTEVPHPVLSPGRRRALDQTPRELYLSAILDAREGGYVVTDFTKRSAELRMETRWGEPGSGPEPYTGVWGLSPAHLCVSGQMAVKTTEEPGNAAAFWARSHLLHPWATRAIISLGEDGAVEIVESSGLITQRVWLFVGALILLILLDQILV